MRESGVARLATALSPLVRVAGQLLRVQRVLTPLTRAERMTHPSYIRCPTRESRLFNLPTVMQFKTCPRSSASG